MTRSATARSRGSPTTSPAWEALSPTALWLLDQAAVTTAVEDRTGTSDQVSRNGTSVVTPTGLTFDVGGAGGLLLPKRLAGPALLTGSAATIYTSAGGSVIETITVSNPSGSAVDLTMSVGPDAAGVRIFDGFSIPADTHRQFRVYQPLTDGQTIQAFGSTTGVLNVTLNGQGD